MQDVGTQYNVSYCCDEDYANHLVDHIILFEPSGKEDKSQAKQFKNKTKADSYDRHNDIENITAICKIMENIGPAKWAMQKGGRSSEHCRRHVPIEPARSHGRRHPDVPLWAVRVPRLAQGGEVRRQPTTSQGTSKLLAGTSHPARSEEENGQKWTPHPEATRTGHPAGPPRGRTTKSKTEIDIMKYDATAMMLSLIHI